MEEINLYKLLGFYVRNWLLILSITLTGLAAGLIYNQFIQVPLYKSNATLLLTKDRGATQDTTLLNNYVQLFQSRRVLEPAIENQKINTTYDAFVGNVEAVNTKGTEVIKLSVSTTNPEQSRNFLSEAVVIFKTEAKKIYGADNLTIVDNASDAVPPYNVKKGQQLAIASAAGFVVSLLVLFFIYDARGGKVDNWGKKRIRAAKTQPAPRTQKTKKTPAAKPLTDTADVHAPRALWDKVKNAAQRGLWIDESAHDERSKDTNND